MTRVQKDEAWGGHTSSRSARLLVFLDQAPNGHSIVFLQPLHTAYGACAGCQTLSPGLKEPEFDFAGMSDFKVVSQLGDSLSAFVQRVLGFCCLCS